MTFLEQLDAELCGMRVRGRVRRRIAAEYTDHLACDPDADLGDPSRLARTFASELAADDARRDALVTFGALAIAAIALLAGQLSVPAAGGYASLDRGLTLVLAVPAVLVMVVAPQVALLAGSLGLLRAWRRHSATSLPDAELALMRRRTSVARDAGLLTCAAMLAEVLDSSGGMAAWWLVLQGGLAVLAAAGLLAQRRWAKTTAATHPGVPGAAGDVFDDVPPLRFLRDHPGWFCGLTAAAVAVVTAALTGGAESSVAEGLERGGFEALAIVGGFVLLGRSLGVRSSPVRFQT